MRSQEHGGRPRVLHVVTHLDLGGAEEVALSLIEHLGGEQQLEVFAVGGVADNAVGRAMSARLAAHGVPVYSGTSLDMKRGGLLQAGLRLASVLRRTRPEMVHLHTEIPETTYALGVLLARAISLGPGPSPVVLRTIHNSTVWPAWQRIGAWAERRLGDASVVAVSQASLSGLQDFRVRHGLPQLPQERCHVVYNGVTLASRPASEAHALPSGGGMRVLFAGRLEPQKGADLLPAILESAAGLTDREAQVTVLGEGTLAPDLRRWVEEGRLRWPVTLELPRPGLSGMLADFDAVLMPSRFEGLPLLAAEALLAGTPVVGTDAPGLREVLPQGYPLLAPVGDTATLARLLAEVVADPGRSREMVRELRSDIERNFGLPRMLEGYRRVYRGLPRGEAGEIKHEHTRGT